MSRKQNGYFHWQGTLQERARQEAIRQQEKKKHTAVGAIVAVASFALGILTKGKFKL